MGCMRSRGEGRSAGAKALADKFLLFHALRPRVLGALDGRAEALHMVLLCPGKTLQRACGISVPCFSLHQYGSLRSLPGTALLSLAKGCTQGWGEAPARPFSGSCTGCTCSTPTLDLARAGICLTEPSSLLPWKLSRAQGGVCAPAASPLRLGRGSFPHEGLVSTPGQSHVLYLTPHSRRHLWEAVPAKAACWWQP